MISKKELMNIYLGLADEVDELEVRLTSLEKRVSNPKRKPGRPKKEK